MTLSKLVAHLYVTSAKPMDNLDIFSTALMFTEGKASLVAVKDATRQFVGSYNRAAPPSIAQHVKDSLNGTDQMRKAARLRSPNGALTHGL